MTAWLDLLNSDPLPWLLEETGPAVRHSALLLLLDRPKDEEEVVESLAKSTQTDPIASILAAQHPDGYWGKSGPSYSPKYTATVWQVIFLDQLGADGSNEGVRRACEYVLSHSQTPSGGFGASGVQDEATPPSPRAIHCLNGNLLRALIGFGWHGDERVHRAIDWQARSITGEGYEHYYQTGTTGPGFCCAANYKEPCAWGAVKAMLALALIPVEKRPPYVQRAIQQGADFLLSRDPAKADYPMPPGTTKPSTSWFKPGFPSGYVADVLQNLEAFCELGYAKDPRLANAVQWLLSKQDKQGRWKNEYAYNGKTWTDFEKQGQPSKWVTLRACKVLRAVFD